jgi:hypothetical protein
MWKRFKRWLRREYEIPFDHVLDLEDAFAWTCEICEQRNYADYVPMEPGSDEIATIKHHNESEDGQLVQVEPGDCQRAPYTVKCMRCGLVSAVGNHYTDLA